MLLLPISLVMHVESVFFLAFSIKDLPNLQDLDFSLNELQGGVDSVSYISSLISLNLADCDLSSLPSK